METTINRLLTHCERWETLMLIIHDLGHFFDHINVATAVHRIAKLSKRQRVRSFGGTHVLPRAARGEDPVGPLLGREGRF